MNRGERARIEPMQVVYWLWLAVGILGSLYDELAGQDRERIHYDVWHYAAGTGEAADGQFVYWSFAACGAGGFSGAYRV